MDSAGRRKVDGIGYKPVATVDCDSAAAADAVRAMASAAVRCSSGRVQQVNEIWIPHGDPMEAALDAFAQRVRGQRRAQPRSEPNSPSTRGVGGCRW